MVGVLQLLAMLAVQTSCAADPPEGGKWIQVPSEIVGVRAVRAAGSPPKTYECVLVVPAGDSPTRAKPRFRQSSGEPALDEVAWEFVRTAMAKSEKLRTLIKSNQLDFRLKLTPPSVAGSVYTHQLFSKKANAQVRATVGLLTPPPPYPIDAQRNNEKGGGRVKIRFSQSTGLPTEVVMEQSTGSHLLDASTVQWVALHWRRTQAGPGRDQITVPIVYALH